MFLKVTDANELWSKIKNHVGVKVEHSPERDGHVLCDQGVVGSDARSRFGGGGRHPVSVGAFLTFQVSPL